MGAYEAFIFCQKNGNAGVDFADCERDEHRVGGVRECYWRRNVYVKLSSLVPDYGAARSLAVRNR